MSGVRAERRTALVAMVEMSWEDQQGAVHIGPARMEDRSPSGACVRVKAPLRVGLRVRVKWQWEQFAGTTRYCRSDGWEYLVGIQRDVRDRVPASASPAPIRERAAGQGNPPPAPTAINQAKRQLGKSEDIRTAVGGAAVSKAVAAKPEVQSGTAKTSETAGSRPKVPVADLGVPVAREPEIRATVPVNVPAAEPQPSPEERTTMSTKWLDMALKRQKPDAPNGKATAVPASGNAAPVKAGSTGEERRVAMGASLDRAGCEGDLLPAEDVYRAAGILNPRMGYSICKVVDMLRSEHIRALPEDAKRAAVLMALDAAGISMDEVLRDAALRRKALDAYEAEQQKHFEESWARKAERNAEIQAEMERVTAQYVERVKRNVEELAREKKEFVKWQTMKRQESGQMEEAAELCGKASVGQAEVDSRSLMAVGGAGSSGEPV